MWLCWVVEWPHCIEMASWMMIFTEGSRIPDLSAVMLFLKYLLYYNFLLTFSCFFYVVDCDVISCAFCDADLASKWPDMITDQTLLCHQ